MKICNAFSVLMSKRTNNSEPFNDTDCNDISYKKGDKYILVNSFAVRNNVEVINKFGESSHKKRSNSEPFNDTHCSDISNKEDDKYILVNSFAVKNNVEELNNFGKCTHNKNGSDSVTICRGNNCNEVESVGTIKSEEVETFELKRSKSITSFFRILSPDERKSSRLLTRFTITAEVHAPDDRSELVDTNFEFLKSSVKADILNNTLSNSIPLNIISSKVYTNKINKLNNKGKLKVSGAFDKKLCKLNRVDCVALYENKENLFALQDKKLKKKFRNIRNQHRCSFSPYSQLIAKHLVHKSKKSLCHSYKRRLLKFVKGKPDVNKNDFVSENQCELNAVMKKQLNFEPGNTSVSVKCRNSREQNKCNTCEADDTSSDIFTGTGNYESIEMDNIKKTVPRESCSSDNSEFVIMNSDAPNLRRSVRQAAALKAKRTMDDITQDELEDTEIVKVKKCKYTKKKKVNSSTIRDNEASKKLAPIFGKRTKNLSDDALHARREFLFSGVPEMLKRQSFVEKSAEVSNDYEVFPKMNHIQQKEELQCFTPVKAFKFLSNSDYGKFVPRFSSYDFGIPKKLEANSEIRLCSFLITLNNICSVLLCLQKESKNIPILAIFKTFLDQKMAAIKRFKNENSNMEVEIMEILKYSETTKKLKKSLSKSKQNNENNLNVSVWHQHVPYCWTELYAPSSSSEVIGHQAQLKNLKQWLKMWKEKLQTEQEPVQSKCKKKKGSENESDEHEGNELVNSVLLTGPSGIGKTSFVYALAKELGYKVLEVNASSHRQGKYLARCLSEATQSHSVSKNNLSVFKDKTADDIKVDHKENDKNDDLLLVLFDDIDVVFDEHDEGFISTVNSFMFTTKRPIVLTASNFYSTVLTKIKAKYSHYTLHYPGVEAICNYLRAMCLVNGASISQKDLRALVKYNRRDIRKCILDLQFWCLSGYAVDYKKTFIYNLNELADKEEYSELQKIFPTFCFTGNCSASIFYGSLSTKIGLLAKLSVISPRKWDVFFSSCSPVHMFSNYEFFLGFPLEFIDDDKRMYPLEPDSAYVRNSSLWEKYNWLSFDEKEVVSDGNELKEKIDQSISWPSTFEILDGISELCETSCLVDMLSEASNNVMLFDSLSEVNDASTIYCANLIHTQSLIENICRISSMKCKNVVNKAIKKCNAKSFKLYVKKPDFAEVFQEKNNFKHGVTSKLTSKCLQNLQLSSQINSRAIFLDYVSCLRSMARFDQLCKAVQHLRRGRKYLSNLSQIGIHISDLDSISLANSLNSLSI